MNLSRKSFLASLAAGGAAVALPGCACPCLCGKKLGKPAVQLYSVRTYIGGNDKVKGVGLAQALKDLAAIGYKGVEFAGYYGNDAKTLKAMLADAGLEACGTHVGRDAFSPEKIKETCEFNLGYGNKYICCPGGGNMPAGFGWDGKGTPTKESDDFIKKLCDYYNKAAETAKGYGCLIGLHNHMWEFQVKMQDGTTYWDYFFSHTDPLVQMEQDVGWTTCAGEDPCAQYLKYPHRSYTLHAKENGMGAGVKTFDAILGKPGEPGAKGVEWDKLFPVSDADGVEWYVVECERHEDTLDAVKPSFEFLKSKGRA